MIDLICVEPQPGNFPFALSVGA